MTGREPKDLPEIVGAWALLVAFVVVVAGAVLLAVWAVLL